jgi:hypothetical protein
MKHDTFEAWLAANLSAGERRDLAAHGADAGWPGLTYYRDTAALYEQYAGEIWSLACDLADDLGEPHALAMIASFRGARDVSSHDQFANLMVWFAAEEYCRRDADESEGADEDEEGDE